MEATHIQPLNDTTGNLTLHYGGHKLNPVFRACSVSASPSKEMLSRKAETLLSLEDSSKSAIAPKAQRCFVLCLLQNRLSV